MPQNIDYQIPPTPKGVTIAITGKCNLSCQYCFYADEMHSLTDLKTEEWLRFFDQLGQLNLMNVTLTGGEAFTRPDLFELIDGIINNRMRYSLLSNGTLIDEKVIENLLNTRRRRRLDSIQISIDGSCADIHNQSRPNSFEAAVHGLKLLKEADFPVISRVTINKYNHQDLDNIASFLLEKMNINSISTNEAVPMGVGCHQANTTALSAIQQKTTMERFKELEQRYPGRIQTQAGPQAKRKMYAQMVEARKTGKKANDWLMGYLSACGCVYSQIDILHDGTIVPCHMLAAIKLGNILTDDLKSIWQTHATLATMRRRRNVPMSEVEGCRDCEWNLYCNGSCPGLAFQTYGSLLRANPQDCFKHYLQEIGEDHANQPET